MPEMICRSSFRSGPGWFLGMNGSITAHCPSLSSARVLTRSRSRTEPHLLGRHALVASPGVPDDDARTQPAGALPFKMRSRSLAIGLSDLQLAGRRLGGDVETAQGVMVRLRGTTADIAAAAEGAMGTAREADSRSRDGAGAVRRPPHRNGDAPGDKERSADDPQT